MPAELSSRIDPSFELISRQPNSLDYIFRPTSVGLIGATEKEGSVGRTVLRNLLSTPFGGTVYPVNPKRSSVLGVHAYPSIKDIPAELDLAVICTAAKVVPQVVRESVEAGVRGIIVISAGFKEMGQEGEALDKESLEAVKGTPVRVVGPNCLGVMSPLSGLNATFAAGMAKPGSVAFISQSGALCTAILDWSMAEQVGFSAFVSIGSMADVSWGDLIFYFGDDPQTSAIVIYMETVGDAAAFLSAAREVALTKPIIIIKPGRTEAAAKAAASHTGSLTGSDDVLEAAFARVGVMRVNNISDLFAMSEVLAKQPLPKGKNLTLVTNAGGPGVLAADALALGGGKLTQVSEQTLKKLDDLLPPHWSRNNPIDVLGDATPEIYAKTLEIAASDPESHGLLVILTPQDMTNPTQTAEALKSYARTLSKPVLASWMGGPSVAAGKDILQQCGIPTFDHPDNACEAFNYLWQYRANLASLYESPEADDSFEKLMAGHQVAEPIINQVLSEKRSLLNEYESKKLLAAYNIPTVPTEIANSLDQAVAIAEEFGFPVVLKLHSNVITHKTDVGGVKLNLQNADAVREAFKSIQNSVSEHCSDTDAFGGVTVQSMVSLEGYEVILGSSLDLQFGPVILFGTGGQLVELYRDKSLALPPLNGKLARRLMQRTKIYSAFEGIRGRKPVNIDLLERILVRFSRLVSHQPWIREIDINPLLVSPDNIVALDARVLLHEHDTPKEELSHVSIQPYPLKYISEAKLRDGSTVMIRPIRPEDEKALVEFHRGLSEKTVLNRFHEPMQLDERITHRRMVRVCFTDYARVLALVATVKDKDEEKLLGVVRIRREYHNPAEAKLALVVTDEWQGKGLGKALLTKGVEAAREEGVKLIGANVRSENEAGIRLCVSIGGEQKSSPVDGMVYVEIALDKNS